MKLVRRPGRLCTLIVITAAMTCLAPADANGQSRPNILLIMADDLGYSDLGCYGGEIDTPNLDTLAAGGLRFTRFYNTGRCWPTRAALLTGFYAQQVRRDAVPDVPSGGRGQRPVWAPLLPEFLTPAGYRSYHVGKWHIDGMPIASGFHRSYYLRDQGRFFSPQVHHLDDEKLEPVERGSGFYGTVEIGNRSVEFLTEHFEEHGESPFFCYVAFTAPHFPLHALPEDFAKYRDKYTDGWEQARDARWERQIDMGIGADTLSEFERDVGPPYHFPEALEILGPGEVNRPVPWTELTPRQQRFQADKMALHAAMIDRIDREVGRVLDVLRSHDAFDNTLIMFLSDNGASAEIMVRSDGHDPAAEPGSAASYLCLGPGWSTVGNTPFRMHKTWVHEGGIATPFIVHWPDGIPARGQLRHGAGHVIDVVPTLLDLVGIDKPDIIDGDPVPDPPGRSLTRLFEQDREFVDRELWWSHEGNRAIRVGDWKLVAFGEDGEWELFDLSADRNETRNLAEQHRDRVHAMAQRWKLLEQKFFTLARGE